MNRRGFLKAILAAGVAPYVVTTAGVLMPVRKIATVPTIIGFDPASPAGDMEATILFANNNGVLTATEIILKQKEAAKRLAE